MKLWWYLARAGGLVSWGLLSASMIWGLALSTKLFRTRPRPAWTLDLHRFLGGGALAFTGLHVAGLVADSYVHFGPAEILLPLASKWHPVAVAWGVLSLYMLAAIEITSLAMRRLSNRTWKRIHRTSFGLFLFTTIHALTAGTDTSRASARWASLIASGTISFLWLLRVISLRRTRAGAPHAASPSRTPEAVR